MIFLFIAKWINNDTRLIPSCVSNVKLNFIENKNEIRSNYLINIINSNEITYLVMTGEVTLNGIMYNIARRYMLDVNRQGKFISVRIINVDFYRTDQIRDDILVRGLPVLNQIYTLLISQTEELGYIFEQNNSPLFYCRGVPD
jgi:hypothetical protein